MSVERVPALRVSILVPPNQLLSRVDLQVGFQEAVVVRKGTPARHLAVCAVAQHGALVLSRDGDLHALAEAAGCVG